jgi:hypothetical protein
LGNREFKRRDFLHAEIITGDIATGNVGYAQVARDNLVPLWRERSDPQPLASESFARRGFYHRREFARIMQKRRACRDETMMHP